MYVWQMFSVLFQAGLMAFERPEHVVSLTASNWESELSKVNETTPYIVLFYGTYCPACKWIHQEFVKAANVSAGMFNFGQLNIAENSKTGRKFKIRHVPTILVFHSKGRIEYSGNGKFDNIIAFSSKFVPDNSKQVDVSWKSNRNLKLVILFTKEKAVPNAWIGISNRFLKDPLNIQVGVTSNKQIFEQYYVTDCPRTIFINGLERMEYNGKFTYKALEASIECFFLGFPQPLYQLESQEELFNVCYQNNICIIGEGPAALKSVASLRSSVKSYPIIFATVTKECKLNLEPGVWALSNTRAGKIKIGGWFPMKTIKEIMLGKAKWIE